MFQIVLDDFNIHIVKFKFAILRVLYMLKNILCGVYMKIKPAHFQQFS